MIATFFVLMLLSTLIVGAALIARATRQRRERLSLTFGATCLICDSRAVDVGVPPDYRCRDCGFDTTKTEALTGELERYAELMAAHEALRATVRETPSEETLRRAKKVQQALDEVRHAILAQMSADGAVDRRPTIDFEHVIAQDYEEL